MSSEIYELSFQQLEDLIYYHKEPFFSFDVLVASKDEAWLTVATVLYI